MLRIPKLYYFGFKLSKDNFTTSVGYFCTGALFEASPSPITSRPTAPPHSPSGAAFVRYKRAGGLPTRYELAFVLAAPEFAVEPTTQQGILGDSNSQIATPPWAFIIIGAVVQTTLLLRDFGATFSIEFVRHLQHPQEVRLQPTEGP